MPTNFPTSLDAYSNPNPTDDVSVVVHSTQHANHNDSIEAIEAKLGINSSAVTSSIDYLLKSSSSSDPGHKHTSASLTGIPDGSGTTNEISYWVDSNTLGALAVATYPSLTEFTYVKGVTSAIQTQINTKANSSGSLTQFVGNTAWRVFYSDASGDIIELALGASGTFLKSNGASSAPTFATPSASVTIGDTITSATEGSVLFAGASGVLAQDNSTFYWNHATDRLGIGTNAKLSRFTVKQAATGAITGTSSTNNSTTVTGSGTLFLSEVGIGDRIEEDGFGYVLVTAIASDTSLTVSPALQGDSNPHALNLKKAISRWDDSSGATVMMLSDEGYLAIGSSVFRPLAPLHIANTNGIKISATATGRGALIYYDDPSGSIVFRRSDISDTLTFTPSSGSMDFSGATNLLGFRLNLGSINFISTNGGGAGKITFGRRVSDNNVACGAAVEFWPTNTQTTPAAAVMAPGGGSYISKWMPDGSFLARYLVEANTAGVGSPNILTAIESRTVLTNEGATAKNYHTLPTAAAGMEFTFIVQDADGIRIVANTGDTIRVAGTVSGSAGYTESTTIGDAITLVSINATEWIAKSYVGTWTTV